METEKEAEQKKQKGSWTWRKKGNKRRTEGEEEEKKEGNDVFVDENKKQSVKFGKDGEIQFLFPGLVHRL